MKKDIEHVCVEAIYYIDGDVLRDLAEDLKVDLDAMDDAELQEFAGQHFLDIHDVDYQGYCDTYDVWVDYSEVEEEAA